MNSDNFNGITIGNDLSVEQYLDQQNNDKKQKDTATILTAETKGSKDWFYYHKAYHYKPRKERSGKVTHISPIQYSNEDLDNTIPKCQNVRHVIIAFLMHAYDQLLTPKEVYLEITRMEKTDPNPNNHKHLQNILPEAFSISTIHNSVNALKNSELKEKNFLLIEEIDKKKHYGLSPTAMETNFEDIIKMSVEKRPPRKKESASISNDELIKLMDKNLSDVKEMFMAALNEYQTKILNMVEELTLKVEFLNDEVKRLNQDTSRIDKTVQTSKISGGEIIVPNITSQKVLDQNPVFNITTNNLKIITTPTMKGTATHE